MGPVNNSAPTYRPGSVGKKAKTYFDAVLSGVIATLVPQSNQKDKDLIMQWLPAAMQELLRKLADGEIPGQVDIFPRLKRRRCTSSIFSIRRRSPRTLQIYCSHSRP